MSIRQNRVQYDGNTSITTRTLSKSAIDKIRKAGTHKLDTDVYGKINDLSNKISAKFDEQLEDTQDYLLSTVSNSKVSSILKSLLGKFIPGIQRDINRKIRELHQDTLRDIKEYIEQVMKDPILISEMDQGTVDVNDIPAIAVTTTALFSHLLVSGDQNGIRSVLSNIPDIRGTKLPLVAIAIRNTVRENNIANIPLVLDTLPNEEIKQWMPDLPNLIMGVADPISIPSKDIWALTSKLDTVFPSWASTVGLSLDGTYHPNKTENNMIESMRLPLRDVVCHAQPKRLSETEILIALSVDKNILM